jgi:hypothetical protein
MGASTSRLEGRRFGSSCGPTNVGPERQGAHAIPIRSGEHGQKPLLDVAADVEDDGYFRVVLLGADYAGGVGDPANAKAVEFIRTQIAEWLAWEDIEATQSKEMDSYQQDTVHKRKRDTLKEAQTAVKNAYELVVFLEKDGSVQAKKITMGAQSLFATLLQEPAFRLFRQKIDAEAIMPTGLYPVWPASDPSVRVRDLYQEFGRQPRRPKLLSSRTVLNTIEDAVQGGVLAVRCVRSDGSEQWFWRSMIDITDWQDTAEAWLPAKAKLTSLVTGAVLPSSLKGLWPKEDSGVTIATLCS